MLTAPEKGRSHTHPERSCWSCVPWEWSSWELLGAGEDNWNRVFPKLCASLCNSWHFSCCFTADQGAATIVSLTKLIMFWGFLVHPATAFCLLCACWCHQRKKSHFSFGNCKGCQQLQNDAVFLSQTKLRLKEKSWYPVYGWAPGCLALRLASLPGDIQSESLCLTWACIGIKILLKIARDFVLTVMKSLKFIATIFSRGFIKKWEPDTKFSIM